MIQENEIDLSRVPQHVAIIMDGNGRWAKQRSLPRSAGHQQGVETVKRITELSTRIGVRYLTLYTFSTENWNDWRCQPPARGSAQPHQTV